MRGRRTIVVDDLFHADLVGSPVEDAHVCPEGKRASLQGLIELSNRLATVAPRGSGPAFAAGQSLNPYPDDYSRAFAFSTIPYPLAQQVALRLPCPRTEVLGRTVGLTTFLDSPTAR